MLVYQEILTPVICPKILDLKDGYSDRLNLR